MDDNGQNGRGELDFHGPGGLRLRVRRYDLMTLLVFAGLALFGYIFFVTIVQIKDGLIKLAEAQREMACIIALPQDDRLKQLGDPNSFCKRIAKWDTT